MVETLIILVLVLLSAGVLAIQVTESVLALRVKKWFGFLQPYPKPLLAFGKFGTWKRMMGTASYLLLPLIICIIAVLRFHAFLADLLDCQYCTAFHISWILLYFALSMPIGVSLIAAPLGILSVYIIERIRR